MTYAYWKAALAGEKPRMIVDQPELGFYRKGIYEKQENKARKRVGWSPVAIFMAPSRTGTKGEMVAIVSNGRIIDNRDKLNELWSYCAAYPISEETYRAVAERGEQWPDSHEEKEPSGYASGNAEAPPEVKIADQIADCEKLLAKYSVIDSDEMSSKARSLQNRFIDLRGEAKKHYDKLNDPLLAEQKRIREIWFPLRDLADAGSVAMRTAMGTWEDTKRAAAKVAAERAGAGQEVRSNVPPPSSQIRGGSGKAANVGTKKVVTAIDIDAVFKQFRDDPRTLEFLTDMAQRAVKAGITVPGATVEEKADIR